MPLHDTALREALLAVKRWQDSPDYPQTRAEHKEIELSHEVMTELLSELDLSWLQNDPPKDNRFSNWLAGLSKTGIIAPVYLGMSRAQLKALFGAPTDWNAMRPVGAIWKYGELAFHFDADDTLDLIHQLRTSPRSSSDCGYNSVHLIHWKRHENRK